MVISDTLNQLQLTDLLYVLAILFKRRNWDPVGIYHLCLFLHLIRHMYLFIGRSSLF